MKCFVFLPLLLVAVVELASAQRNFNREWRVEKMYRGNLMALQTILAQPQMPERYLTGRESFHVNLKGNDHVLGFSWSNCGSGSDPVQMNVLSIGPDPVSIPGNLNVGFNISTTVDITKPFELDLDISKKVAFWWVAVPCIDNVGSCDYKDFCTMLPNTCPPSFQQYNIPCNCPAQKGNYAMPDGVVTIPELPIPSWLTSGDYKVKLQGKDSNGNNLFCFTVQLSLD